MVDDYSPAEGDHVSAFKWIRRVNAADDEYWSSRELTGVWGYTDYRNFDSVIGKGKAAYGSYRAPQLSPAVFMILPQTHQAPLQHRGA